MSGDHPPRVSILIPNYNNGRASSRSGEMDLIGNLLASLWDTLHDEPTPFELMVHDDGSSDDSIETLRAWAQKTWPDGRPFLTLVESPHEGFIAAANNRMYARARGDIFVRLDGDIVVLTRHWVSRIAAIFDHGPPELGIVGPKQLNPDGTIHAMGDWLLHPNGYTHIANGLDRHAVRWPVVCDHNMGCFYCCKRQLFEDIGGYDENCLRGETEDFTLRARLTGWTALATPEVEFVHYHGFRHHRPSRYDKVESVKRDLAYFERKWGFHRIAPDLDVVRDRYAGTPLVWNARWFALDDADPPDAPDPEPLPIERTAWKRFEQDAAFRQRIEHRVAVTRDVLAKLPEPRPQRIVQVGADSGLIAHLLANQGIAVVGIERSEAKVNLARRCTADRDYPAGAPSFTVQRESRSLPLATDQAEMVLLFDVLERHANPVGLLKEVRRVLQPGGVALIVGPRREAGEDAPTDPEHRYTWQQLANQLELGLGLRLLNSAEGGSTELIAVAQVPADTQPRNASSPGETTSEPAHAAA